MKKQLRLVLFAALVMILVMMTALCASAAATDGAEVREDGHYYEVVSSTSGAAPKYYTTLASAVASVDADGYTIKLLADVTEPAITLDKAYSYTITGGEGAKLTFSNTVKANKKATLVNLAAGKVKFENLTISYDEAKITTTLHYVFCLSADAVELTLDNVVYTGEVNYVLYAVGNNTVTTVTGSKSSFSNIKAGGAFYGVEKKTVGHKLTVDGAKINTEGRVVWMTEDADAEIGISNTVMVGKNTSLFYFHNSNKNRTVVTTLEITNSVISTTGETNIFQSATATPVIKLLNGTKVTVNNKNVFQVTTKIATVELNGAELEICDKNGALANVVSDALMITASVTDSKITFRGSESTPAAIFDTVIDWSQVDVFFDDHITYFELTEAGVYNVTSLEDNLALAKAAAEAKFLADNATRFPKLGINLTSWINLVVNNPEATVNLLAGEYTARGDYLLGVKQGQLNIRDGALLGLEDGAALFAAGGTLNVMGGTVQGADGGCAIRHEGGTVNVTGGTLLSGTDTSSYIIHSELVTPEAEEGSDEVPAAPIGDINISGGTFNSIYAIYVEGDAAVTVNVSGGTFANLDGETTAYGAYVDNAFAILNISGGVMQNMTRAIWGISGTINISGGEFYINGSASKAHLLYIDGPAKLNVTPNEGGAELDPLFQLQSGNGNHIALYVSSRATEAEINISGGKFGGMGITAGNVTFYAVYIEGAIQNFNITGGEFVGGSSNCAIMIKAAGAVVNMSGTAAVYGYRNFYVQADATLNIAGGSYNPRPNGLQANNILIHVTSGDNAKINISGGEFNDFMRVLTLGAACEVNITGGVFNSRLINHGDTNQIEVFAYITAAAQLYIGSNTTGGVDPVINLNKSEKGDSIYNCRGIYVTNTAAQVAISGGTFNTVNKDNLIFDFPADGIKMLVITGGTFSITGEGAGLLPESMDKAVETEEKEDGTFEIVGGTVLTGATVKVRDGAVPPIYKNVSSAGLHIVVVGEIKVALNIWNPKADDETGDGYVITTPADLYAVMQTQFASFTADPTAFTTWLPLEINGEGVVVTLRNVNDVYDVDTLVTVIKGTLKVDGGTFAAKKGEKLFAVMGEDAVLSITGGSYSAVGARSYVLYVGDEAKLDNISVANATLHVAELGSAPLQVTFSVTADQVTVNGMSEIRIDDAGEYTITQVSDLTNIVKAVLEQKFTENLTVDIQTFVPLYMNNAGLSITFTGGEYNADSDFMFKIAAGSLTITGGKYTNVSGDIIQIVGPDVNVTIDLTNEGETETNGMYTTGRVIYANTASKSSILIKNGRFVELAYDASNNQKDALFVFDNGEPTTQNVTFKIENGYFEATRILLLYYAKVNATIDDGVFVSNCVVDGTTITARPTNAHMLSPRGAGAVLTINGGSFDNKQGNYIIAQNGYDGAATTISGGSFKGGSGWFFTNYKTTFTINAHPTDPEKNPVFTDTEGYATEHYIYLNHAEAVMVINAGTFTGTVSTADIFHVAKGILTVNDGTFEGSLFYVTTEAKVTVNGGTYKATGAGSVLFELVGSVSNENFNIATALTFRAENNTNVLDTTLGQSAARALLANANILVNGNIKLGTVITLTADETWATPADAQHLVLAYFPTGKITFETPGVYALTLSGNKTVTITGGDWLFPGATLFTLRGGADLVITGGSFYVDGGGDIINVEGDSTVTIGKKEDPTCEPSFVVGFGGNVIHATASPATFTIYNGSFIKGEYVDVDGVPTLQPVIDYENYTSPLFYFEKGKVSNGVPTLHHTLIIYDGYYEATRVLMDYYGYGTNTIYGGEFKSNYNKKNLTALGVEFDENGRPLMADPTNNKVLYDSDKNYLLNVRGTGASLTIYGGDFDAAYARAIIGLAGQGGTTFNFYGGTFTGGYNWFYCNYAVTLNFASKENTWTGETNTPTFRASDTHTRYGFYLDVNAADKHIDLNIEDGFFSMKDQASRYMFVLKGDIDVNVSGGSFTVTPGTYKDETDDELQNYTMIFTSYAQAADLWVDLNISGGTFTAAYMIAMSSGRAHLNISGGTFKSNAASMDNSNMIYAAYAGTTIYISGGSFTGNKYTYHHIYMTGGADMELTIVGGTFDKGLRWIYLNAAGMKVTFDKTAKTAPVFKELSDGTGVDRVKKKAANITVYGMYIHRNCMGSTIDFNYGKFVLPVKTMAAALFVVEGGDITFGPGITAEAPSRIFQITNAFKGTIRITGGTYTATDVCNMFYVTVSLANATNNGAIMDSRIIIEDGTFNSIETSTMFHLISQVPEYQVQIKGGKFNSADSRMFFYDGTGMTVTIEGGEFTSTASRMIYLDNNTTPMVIKGGTFILQDKSGNNADNGIIYAVGKNASSIVVQGGTFIDQRTGSNQVFIKMNEKADIRFEGDFKIYSLYKKTNFYFDYDNDENSMPMNDQTPTEEYDDEVYYVCFSYYSQYAPEMVGAPVIRPVLGAEGITFTSQISPEVIEYLSTLGTLSYGTLIFPTDHLLEGWENGTDFLAELKEYAAEYGKDESRVYAMVAADKGMTTAEDGTITIRASLININEKNHTRSMTGIGYIKVVAPDGTETYYYANHISAGVSQNMRAAAKYALTDLDTKPFESAGRVYCYPSIMRENRFSRYSPVLQDSLRKYLAAVERKPNYK